MKRTVEKLENCKTNITVVFEEKEWKDARAVAFKKLAANVEIKGFRKGKAPENLVKARIQEAEVMQHAIDELLPNAYTTALQEEKIEPFARPNVSVTKMSDNECEVVIAVVTRPEVELGEYKGLHIGHQEVKVDDESLAKEIAKRLKDNAELVLKETEAQKGDTVVIDFEGFVDGAPFEGGKAENYSLELGSNSFIPGFEEQLVGVKAEQDVEVNVTFPAEYPAENLAGKPTLFKVKIHEVKEKRIPELNDEFVGDLEIKDVKNAEEYRNFVKEDLQKHLGEEENNRYFGELLSKIRAGAKVAIPQEIVDEEIDAMYENLKKQVEQNGLDIDQYLQITKQSVEAIRTKMGEEALRNITNFFVMEKVGEVEQIDASDEMLEFEVQKLATLYNMEADKVKEIVFKDKARFAENVRREQISQFLLKNND